MCVCVCVCYRDFRARKKNQHNYIILIPQTRIYLNVKIFFFSLPLIIIDFFAINITRVTRIAIESENKIVLDK